MHQHPVHDHSRTQEASDSCDGHHLSQSMQALQVTRAVPPQQVPMWCFYIYIRKIMFAQTMGPPVPPGISGRTLPSGDVQEVECSQIVAQLSRTAVQFAWSVVDGLFT